MSTALFTELSSYFNMDPDDPTYQKELIRPAEIKEDVKLMEQRQRVSKIMKSKIFKKELETIVKLNGFDEDYDGVPTSTLSLAEISEQLLLAAIPKNKIQNYSQLHSRSGVICINDLQPGSAYGRLESQYRCKLAAVFRLTDMYGWSGRGAFNTTMTARPFRDHEQFLVNPFGLMFHEVTASSFLSIDFKGNILDFGSTVLDAHNSAWMVHAALYSFRADIRCILHLKTPSAIAVSSLDSGLLPMCREAMVLGDCVILTELAGLEQEANKSTGLLLADIKNHLTACAGLATASTRLLMVPNHGFLVCGESVEEAWHHLSNCEIACETQIKLGSIALDDLILPDKMTRDAIFHEWRNTDIAGITDIDKNNNGETSDGAPVRRWRLGELEFEALMRHLDNQGYRTGHLYRQLDLNQSAVGAVLGSGVAVNRGGRFDVEIPASSSSCVSAPPPTALGIDQEVPSTRSRQDQRRWFNTPNQYRALLPDNAEADMTLTESSSSCRPKWVPATDRAPPVGSRAQPHRPITAGACVPFGVKPTQAAVEADFASRHISPREIIENQKKLRHKYYTDATTAGPISCLLDSGLTREEAVRMKAESMRRQQQRGPTSASADDLVITSASKGIIQRGHNAIVYQDLYRPANPFEKVTAEDIAEYHREVDRKQNPDMYQQQAASLDDGVDRLDREAEEEASMRVTSLHSEPEMGASAAVATADQQQRLSGSGAGNECDTFFQTDFDEDDFFKLCSMESGTGRMCSPLLTSESDQTVMLQTSPRLEEFPATPTVLRSASTATKEPHRTFKSLRSLSFKMLNRSRSARDSGDVLEVNKAATLAAPGHGYGAAGTITSETSGADFSHEEGDKDGKNKKKKRKFKFPFSKKKKEKSK